MLSARSRPPTGINRVRSRYSTCAVPRRARSRSSLLWCTRTGIDSVPSGLPGRRSASMAVIASASSRRTIATCGPEQVFRHGSILSAGLISFAYQDGYLHNEVQVGFCLPPSFDPLGLLIADCEAEHRRPVRMVLHRHDDLHGDCLAQSDHENVSPCGLVDLSSAGAKRD